MKEGAARRGDKQRDTKKEPTRGKELRELHVRKRKKDAGDRRGQGSSSNMALDFG